MQAIPGISRRYVKAHRCAGTYIGHDVRNEKMLCGNLKNRAWSYDYLTKTLFRGKKPISRKEKPYFAERKVDFN